MTIIGDAGIRSGDQTDQYNANESIRIKAQIIGRLEKYLSPENVKKDPAVAKQFVDGKIALSALSGVIKSLTSDRELLLSALKDNKTFVLDPTHSWVTIRKQKERNVLILREIPTDTSVEEVKQIFAEFKDLPEIKNIHSDIGNNWFITFNNEDDCMTAALKLSTEGKFKGKSLKVRVKANLAQAEQHSPFGSPRSPARRYPNRKPTFRRSPYFNSSMYSPHRGPVMRSPARRGMPYPPPMALGSPLRRPAPVAAISSDYTGDFKQFTTQVMRDVIKRKYGAEVAPKPISLDSDEVRDIVTKRPKTTVSEPVVLREVPDMKELNLNASGGSARVDTRKKDKTRRKKVGDSGRVGRPAGGRASQSQRGSKQRGQKNAKRRSDKGGKKEALK